MKSNSWRLLAVLTAIVFLSAAMAVAAPNPNPPAAATALQEKTTRNFVVTYKQLIDLAKSKNLPYGVFEEIQQYRGPGGFTVTIRETSSPGSSLDGSGLAWDIYLSKLNCVDLVKAKKATGLDQAYNEFVNLFLIMNQGNESFAWANSLIDNCANTVYQPILVADFKANPVGIRPFRSSTVPAGLAHEMVEEAMSEMADGMALAIPNKREPVLRDGVWGDPSHNSQDSDKWFALAYRRAAKKAVPVDIRNLNLWIMYYGTVDPVPGGTEAQRLKKMNDFWNDTFKKR